MLWNGVSYSLVRKVILADIVLVLFQKTKLKLDSFALFLNKSYNEYSSKIYSQEENL